MADWRIYYEGGKEFSSEDGNPEDAPRTGVLVVANRDHTNPRGFTLAHGKDYYLWRNGGWDMADIGGFWDYLMIGTGTKCVVFGRTVRGDEYWDIVGIASEKGVG